MPDSPEIYLIAQLLGFIGTAVVVIGMQQKTYKNIAICKISNQFLAAMHYFLLGGYTGMVTNLVSCITNGCYYFRIKKGKSTLPFVIAFSVLFVAIGFLSWQGPISIFVILAKLFSTISLGVKEPKNVRLINLLYNPFWLIYDIYVRSIAGCITDIMIILSTAIAILRLDILPRRKQAN